jgi:hypothetical protein
MTEDQARSHAEALVFAMGITFYFVHSREGRLLSVQMPPRDLRGCCHDRPADQRTSAAVLISDGLQRRECESAQNRDPDPAGYF